MPLQMSVAHGPFRDVPRRELARRAAVMAVELQIEELDVSIFLTNDEQIHDLNRTYRHKDKPTDVLAFALREGEYAEQAGGMLGDVVISVETARVQARERDVPTLEEVSMLLAHGLLHLLGWDHETAAEDRRMRTETERLLVLARRPPAKAKAKAKTPAKAKAKAKTPVKAKAATKASAKRPSKAAGAPALSRKPAPATSARRTRRA